jgi:hypothetical protein
MFDPTRRLIEEIAAAIEQYASAKLLTADGLARWAKRQYEQTYHLLDEDGRRMPLSPEQIERGAGVAVERRQREL